MDGTEDSPSLSSDVEQPEKHRHQGFSDSFPEAANPETQRLQILSDITGEVETRAGIEEIQSRAELIRAQARMRAVRGESKPEDQNQVQINESQDKESGAVREESKAKDQKKDQNNESQDKDKGDSDKQKSQGGPEHSGLEDLILKILEELKKLLKSAFQFSESLKKLIPWISSLFKFMRGT